MANETFERTRTQRSVEIFDQTKDAFQADAGAMDAVMYQYWVSTGSHDTWLAAEIEEQVRIS